MSKTFISPYGITMREGGRIDIFPAAEVWFPTKGDEWTSLFLVVDSGAAISALPRSDASVLGIDPEKGKRTLVGGVGKELLHGWQHSIRVQMGGQTMVLPVVFLENDSAPRVLGRAGIFERFTVIFEERKRRTAFLGEGTKERRYVEKTLNALPQSKSLTG